MSETPDPSGRKTIGARDVAAGVLVLVIGIAVAIAALDLNLGTPQRMGSGFLPLWLGILMCAVGVLISLSALRGGEGLPEFPTFRPLLALILGFAAFAFLVGPFGLIAAAFAGVFIASFGTPQVKFLQAALFAAALAGLAALLFVGLLDVPIRVWPINIWPWT